MKAVTWHGKHDVRVEAVPDPKLQEPTDVIIRVTSTAICGSDLHLYSVLGAFMSPGDVLGHEPMGVVEEVGREVTHVKKGDRVVIPFNISCGDCLMCNGGLQSQCETTQVREQNKGAALLGFSELYGQVPGGQAEYLRVPQGHYGPIPVPMGPPDTRFLYLSDVLPTAWQAVEYANIPKGGTVAVFGLGPIGQMVTRIAKHRGARVIGLDRVTERLQMAARQGIEVLDTKDVDRVPEALRELTQGRGPDSVVDAVGMEAHGGGLAKAAQDIANVLPDAVGKKVMNTAGVDRMTALWNSLASVRRGGTVSIIGVYGGMADPMPMMEMFDRQVTLRMGQANVKRWIDDIMPLLTGDDDPLGVDSLATHHLPLSEAPKGYEMFQKKTDGCVKVVLNPLNS